VFITGITGFVGGFIARELLELRVTVHCLVRADDEKQAMQRLVTTFAEYGLWKPGYAPLVHVVLSEMAQHLSGLSRDAFEDLPDRVDAICHSGALVNWVRPLDNFIDPNIISTHKVLRLASHGRGKAREPHLHLVDHSPPPVTRGHRER
jgi:thioester reductase-like protein